ncbi:MAG TPA: hypothetical protein VFQ88_10720 [Nevskiaceae bacterium]|nr:hypothetical protein [Nevskiaceae bacterium]
MTSPIVVAPLLCPLNVKRTLVVDVRLAGSDRNQPQAVCSLASTSIMVNNFQRGGQDLPFHTESSIAIDPHCVNAI